MKIESAEFFRSAFAKEDLVADDRPQIAFVGRSNVGKSSLMNALLSQAGRSSKGLAKTSSTPGRTRSVNYFLVDRCSYFVDLPGYGYAKAGRTERAAWAELIDDYFHFEARPERQGRILVVQLVDAKVGATSLDVEAREYLRNLNFTQAVVATKIDRLGSNQRPKALSEIRRALSLDEGEEPLAVSARSSEGMDRLWRRIAHHLKGSRSSKSHSPRAPLPQAKARPASEHPAPRHPVPRHPASGHRAPRRRAAGAK